MHMLETPMSKPEVTIFNGKQIPNGYLLNCRLEYTTGGASIVASGGHFYTIPVDLRD